MEAYIQTVGGPESEYGKPLQKELDDLRRLRAKPQTPRERRRREPSENLEEDQDMDL
jgi:hypothetical protein